MESLPLELKRIILDLLDARSAHEIRATSKEWSKMIKCDTFIFYLTNLSALEALVPQLMRYQNQIGLTLRNPRITNYYAAGKLISKLTHLTKLDVPYKFHSYSLAVLTNLQCFETKSHLPHSLLLNYSRLTKLKIKHNACDDDRIYKVLEIMSDLKHLDLTVQKEDEDLLSKLPNPLKLDTLHINANDYRAWLADYSETIAKFQNVTNLTFTWNYADQVFPQYLLPNLETLDYDGMSISQLETNQRLTSLRLWTQQNFISEVAPQLTALPSLKMLIIYVYAAERRYFQFLTALTALEHFEFTGDDIQLVGETLWTSFRTTRLTRLAFKGNEINFTENIMCLNHLQSLKCEGATNVHYLSYLTNLTQLEVIDYNNEYNSVLGILTHLKSLHVTSASSATMDLDQLKFLGNLTVLVDLHSKFGITNALYDSMSSLVNLTKLVMEDGNAHLDLVINFTALEYLDLVPPIGEDNYINLALLTNLHTLIFRGTSGNAVRHLTTLTKLTHLVTRTSVSEDNIITMFPKLRYLKSIYLEEKTD